MFKEGSTFRGMLKTKAQEVARNKYDLEPDWEAGFGQAAFNEYVSNSAREYIIKSTFMHDGVDDQVCITNPCLTVIHKREPGQKK